jgi:hypothetical protein
LHELIIQHLLQIGKQINAEAQATTSP